MVPPTPATASGLIMRPPVWVLVTRQCRLVKQVDLLRRVSHLRRGPSTVNVGVGASMYALATGSLLRDAVMQQPPSAAASF